MKTEDPVALLRKLLKDKTQVALARELDVSASYLNDVLNGRREPGDAILSALNLTRTTIYTKQT